MIIINQFLWLSTNCFFSSSVHEHAWFCAFQSLGHPGHLDYRLFFFYVFFILHAFFILHMTLGPMTEFPEVVLSSAFARRMDKWVVMCSAIFRTPGAHVSYAFFLVFFILHAFFSLIWAWDLVQNFRMLFCLEIFVVLNLLASITSLKFLGDLNYMICTIKDSKHLWNCLIKNLKKTYYND